MANIRHHPHLSQVGIKRLTLIQDSHPNVFKWGMTLEAKVMGAHANTSGNGVLGMEIYHATPLAVTTLAVESLMELGWEPHQLKVAQRATGVEVLVGEANLRVQEQAASTGSPLTTTVASRDLGIDARVMAINPLRQVEVPSKGDRRAHTRANGGRGGSVQQSRTEGLMQQCKGRTEILQHEVENIRSNPGRGFTNLEDIEVGEEATLLEVTTLLDVTERGEFLTLSASRNEIE